LSVAERGSSVARKDDVGAGSSEKDNPHLVVVNVIGNILNDLVRFRSDLHKSATVSARVVVVASNCRNSLDGKKSGVGSDNELTWDERDTYS